VTTVSLDKAALHLIPDAATRGETIVYLRLLDASGRVAKERRLSVTPGQEAVYDLGAYGLHGDWNLELVSTGKFEGFVQSQEPGRFAHPFVHGGGPEQ
jgi:hypothetical protein